MNASFKHPFSFIAKTSWRRLCGSPEGKPAEHTGAISQQPPAGYSFAPTAAAPAAAPAASTAADDLRLLRPIDPTNPSYYWKPLPGSDGKGKATAGSTIDSILGAQVCAQDEGQLAFWCGSLVQQQAASQHAFSSVDVRYDSSMGCADQTCRHAAVSQL